MRRFLIQISIYCLAVFVALNAIAFLSLYSLRRANFYKPQFIVNGVSEDNFDYVVLGSSTGLTTLDTKLIDSLTNRSGLNISMDDSGLGSHYLMLQHFYEQNKTTKYLVLAITPWDISTSDPSLNSNDYRFLPNVSEKCVANYYWKMERSWFKTLSFSKYFPIFGVSYYNTEIFFPSIVAAIRPESRNRFDDRGNYSYPVSRGVMNGSFREFVLELRNPYYFKIKEFCAVHGIELLLYQSPLFNAKVISDDGINLLNHSEFINDHGLFYDNLHVNARGREMCSYEFAQYLMRKK